MIQLTQQSYIAGQWLLPLGTSFYGMDPVAQQTMAMYQSCTEMNVAEALESAQYAYHQYSQLSNDHIANFLSTIADQIEALGDQLLEVADAETGLGLARLTGERGRTCGQLRAFAAIVATGEWVQASIDTADAERQPLPKPDLRRMLRPIGPVAVFGASNFPFAFGTLGGDTASALAAGNPVIVKGHPSHPATNELFAVAIDRAIKQCKLPNGVFSMLQGVTHELGRVLVTHPAIEAVGFTGSLRGGRALMNLAAARSRPIPVFAEMGSVNPVFITPGAIARRGEQIAIQFAQSVALGCGQFCTSPGIAVVLREPQFIDQLLAAFEQMPAGQLLNQQIAEAFQTGMKQLAAKPAVELLTVYQPNQSAMTPQSQLLVTSAEAFLADDTLQQEVFGPSTLVVECSSLEQMYLVADACHGNLTATIHHQPDESSIAKRLFEALSQRVGRVISNGFPTGVEVCPSQQHGGPYPASSAPSTTSVGADAITRFARFVSFQDAPDELLPAALKNSNPLAINRRLNNELTTAAID
ncbi:2,5-dioxovalerate dehydrogenase [Neiella marina]|uniref:2,5-dioxovalerate dehydrogenase n=1 Tax=Neiella marina TaxID=508461 RepID=A0A8J2XLM0_9GAMM|nr:aldehyde dehydrogenase (NADP(+)) [Neiella marina]GGA70515.1 2,5-dioxovalerate dehydrogenase [Neiella marina]